MMPGRASAASFVLLLLLAAACSPRGEPDGRCFELTGVVTGRDAASSRVLVALEAIQDLMPAMTMPFEVRGDAPSLRAGDRIAATLVVTETATWLENVRITAVSAGPAAGAPAASRAAPGALVPDLSLTDQAGRSITLRNFAGRVLVVTFIYTRCPLPDFCPLMVRHLESVRQRAESEGMTGSLALLGVTLDPAYDTPAVLKEYGESVLPGEDLFAQAPLAGVPDEILNPVEVSGADAQPVLGRLPGQKRMYVLPAGAGEFHRVGSQVMKRIARPADTGDVHELATFTGNPGATMPRHAHLGSHAAMLVLRGEIEFELAGERWMMRRGDFANLPPGTPHGWTLRSDRAQLALFSMNHRIGAAFTAMGTKQDGPQIPAGVPHEIPAGALARAADAGDFQLAPGEPSTAAPVKVANVQLPITPGHYVLADGGGERFGGNTFLARHANTTGQFLFIITEGGPGGGVGAHFHARHFENFFGLDGETLGWAYGKAVPIRMGDYFQAPPRNLHGFRLNQEYNRFAAFLTPGIFESFFVFMGRRGAGGGRAGAPDGRGSGGTRGRGEFAGGAPEMFRKLQMSGRGPDGYPLDVHPPKLPLPPQDPVWTSGAAAALADRAALLAHAQAICGVPISRAITPELRRALALKPRQEDFI